MSIFSKIAAAGLSETVSSIGTAIDGIVTNDEERGQIKNELTRIVTEHSQNLTKSATEVVLAEANGSWLQRSWRPVIMLAFGFIIVYEYFLSKVFHWPSSDLPEKFWNLLEIGMGGYVIGRSVENVTKTVAANLDKLPGKRK